LNTINYIHGSKNGHGVDTVYTFNT